MWGRLRCGQYPWCIACFIYLLAIDIRAGGIGRQLSTPPGLSHPIFHRGHPSLWSLYMVYIEGYINNIGVFWGMILLKTISGVGFVSYLIVGQLILKPIVIVSTF